MIWINLSNPAEADSSCSINVINWLIGLMNNETEKEVYVFAFFNQPEDDNKWTYAFDYSTEWIKIPAKESIELKFNKDKHTGWYGGVLFGNNDWFGENMVKVENIPESLTTTITGFNENGKPIVK